MGKNKLNTTKNTLDIQSNGIFFRFYINGIFDWQELKGPYRNRFMKTPEDLIQSLKQLNWYDDDHYARCLTMDAYMELYIPKYDRPHDVCIFKLYTEITPKIIVVKEKELATYKELVMRDGWNEKSISLENQNKPAVRYRMTRVETIKPNDLVVHKDDLHEIFPQKTKGISPKILDLFYPNIRFINNAMVNTK